MNYWEIGKALESAAKAIQEMPGSFMGNTVEDVENKYKEMLASVAKMQEFSQKCIADLKALDDAYVEECDRICRDLKARQDKVRECINSFNYDEIRRVTELVTAIEKLRSINPNDLSLFIEVLGKAATRSIKETKL